MEILAIAALTEKGRVIGKDGDMPWPRLKADLRRFKQMTTGHVLLMGRKTFDSIIDALGSPLDDRMTLVLTGDKERAAKINRMHGALAVSSISEGIKQAEKLKAKRLYVAGGGGVYESFVNGRHCKDLDQLVLTIIEEEHEGDTFFPEWKHLTEAPENAGLEAPFALCEMEKRDGFRFESYRREREGYPWIPVRNGNGLLPPPGVVVETLSRGPVQKMERRGSHWAFPHHHGVVQWRPNFWRHAG